MSNLVSLEEYRKRKISTRDETSREPISIVYPLMCYELSALSFILKF
jgi:hypothetical protein